MIETAQHRELAGAQIEGFRLALEVIYILKQLLEALEKEVARLDPERL